VAAVVSHLITRPKRPAVFHFPMTVNATTSELATVAAARPASIAPTTSASISVTTLLVAIAIDVLSMSTYTAIHLTWHTNTLRRVAE